MLIILIILMTVMTSNSKSYLKLIRSDKVTFIFSLSYPGYLRCTMYLNERGNTVSATWKRRKIICDAIRVP